MIFFAEPSCHFSVWSFSLLATVLIFAYRMRRRHRSAFCLTCDCHPCPPSTLLCSYSRLSSAINIIMNSVADPGCLSRIPDPDFYPSRISDPGSKNSNKREGWKKISCHNFLCSHKFHKIANYFSFEVLKKKIWANFQRIIELFTQKIVTKLSKIWIWDPGSGINLFWIPDPGAKKAPDPGSGSATLIMKVPVPFLAQ